MITTQIEFDFRMKSNDRRKIKQNEIECVKCTKNDEQKLHSKNVFLERTNRIASTMKTINLIAKKYHKRHLHSIVAL